MDDKRIIDLFFARSEDALSATASKYGKYLKSIAYNILNDDGDSEECVNDTYLSLWNSIPPSSPASFSAFAAKIVRNLSLDRRKLRDAEKRGGDSVQAITDELLAIISDKEDDLADSIVLRDTVNGFLASLNKEARIIFIRRYWYFSSVSQLATDLGCTEGKVKMSLVRSREKLKKLLEKEGVFK